LIFNEKLHKPCGVLDDLSLAVEKSETIQGFSSLLSWSHYRTLSKIEHKNERLFYEIEAEKEGWSVPVLERQIHSFLFARLLKSKDKEGVLELAKKGQLVKTPTDSIKDPYILDFLGLPDSKQIHESKLETAIIDNLQLFLLELGKGFAFVSRQKRLQYEDDFFYIDLVFYNCILKCYLLIDLKVGKLTHQDVGQMDSYVRMFNDLFVANDDNPTIGLILCSEKNEAIAKYSVLNENKQLFASKYLTYLPSEEELQKELKRERNLIEEKKS
jgi:predicted nuclease of restriction endonuclease-like (RecB) superfamily